MDMYLTLNMMLLIFTIYLDSKGPIWYPKYVEFCKKMSILCRKKWVEYLLVIAMRTAIL